MATFNGTPPADAVNSDNITNAIVETYPGEPIGIVTDGDVLVQLDMPDRTVEELQAVITMLQGRFPALIANGSVTG